MQIINLNHNTGVILVVHQDSGINLAIHRRKNGGYRLFAGINGIQVMFCLATKQWYDNDSGRFEISEEPMFWHESLFRVVDKMIAVLEQGPQQL